VNYQGEPVYDFYLGYRRQNHLTDNLRRGAKRFAHWATRLDFTPCSLNERASARHHHSATWRLRSSQTKRQAYFKLIVECITNKLCFSNPDFIEANSLMGVESYKQLPSAAGELSPTLLFR